MVSSSFLPESLGCEPKYFAYDDRLADRYISVNWDVEELLAKKDEIVERDLLKVGMRL